MQLVEETCDITLTELRAKLIAEGHTFGIGTPWRFFRRRGVTWKMT